MRSGLCLVGLLAASVAQAQSAGELRARGREIANEIAAQRSGGGFNAAAQQAAVDRLGKVALAFIDLSDRTANAGGAGQGRDAMREAYEAISGPLQAIYDDNAGTIERLTKQVIDEDGDLEALYEAAPFVEAQRVAAHALYYLNWLHYYGARLYDGDKRKTLLEKAQRGFSEFAVGDRRSDLLVESLLGRGLCHLELGNTQYAVHDLEAVIRDATASPERKAKARMALLDGYVRTGNVKGALKLSDEMLSGGSGGQDNLVRYLRVRALLDGAKKASGAEAERYRQQALAGMDQLRRAGGRWEEAVAALTASTFEDPSQLGGKSAPAFAKWDLARRLMQKGDYKQATPLLEGVLASNDLRRQHGEAHYLLGLAKFQAGQYQEAAEQLDAALQEEKPGYGADAAYMRFKAREALVAQSPTPDFNAQYEQAVREYLAAYPSHKSAFEARYRLGELLQAQHHFQEAIATYAEVSGDPSFELRARFATLQCRYEVLQTIDPRTGGAQVASLVADIGKDLEQFDALAAAQAKPGAKADGVPVGQLYGKVAVMRAVYATLQPEPNPQVVLDSLAGFEKTYPDLQEMQPQVTRLRLNAQQRLGRFADAEAEVQAHGKLLATVVGAAAIEEMAVGFVREGSRRKNTEGEAVHQAAERVASRLYELLLAEGDGSNRAKLTLARLYENTGQIPKATELYSEILQGADTSPAALRGLGRIAETEQRLPDALGYWQRLIDVTRGGDAGWYEAHYQVARLSHATGKTKEACTQLQQLKPTMPGLADADLRAKFDALYQQACR